MVTFDANVDWGRAAWIALAVVLAAALLFVLYSFIGTFVFAAFIYYATRRLYRRLDRRIGSPSLAAALSLVLLALPAVVLLVYTVAIALQEFQRVAAGTDVGPILDVVGPVVGLTEIVEDPRSILTSGLDVDSASRVLDSALASLGVVGTGLLHMFVMFAIAFYLLRDGPRFARWASGYTDERGVLEEYARAVDESLHAVFYGNILNAIITGVVGAIAFSLVDLVAPGGLGVPYPALTGLLTGIASLIPVVGMKLVYVPLVIYLGVRAVMAASGLWFVGLFAAVAFFIVDLIPDIVVRPYVSGGTLHVGSLMFAYILGPLLFGWYGIFLGPVILVFVDHFVRFVLPELLASEPIRPHAVDPAGSAATSMDADAESPGGAASGRDTAGEGDVAGRRDAVRTDATGTPADADEPETGEAGTERNRGSTDDAEPGRDDTTSE